MNRKTVILVLIFFLSAIFCSCASLMGVSLREQVEIKSDEFEPNITINGIELPIDNNPYEQYFLRSFVNKKSKSVLHQLYVNYTYAGDWRFFNRAYAKGSKELKFTGIKRDVNCSSYGCSYNEHFGITIPGKYLRNNTGGFSVKVLSKSGHDLVLKVSGKQITEQIKAVDSVL